MAGTMRSSYRRLLASVAAAPTRNLSGCQLPSRAAAGSPALGGRELDGRGWGGPDWRAFSDSCPPIDGPQPAGDTGRASTRENLDQAGRITKVGAGCNVGLAALKTAAGYVSGSTALMADGVASLSDLVSDGITLWSMEAARKPSDADHPYGHGRLETIGSLGVGGLLAVTGAGMGYASLEAALSVVSGAAGPMEGPLWVAAAAAGVSLVVKEALFHATRAAGERAASKVVIANAWNHRTDALSSLMALVGVGGAMAGVPPPVYGATAGHWSSRDQSSYIVYQCSWCPK
mmetsp:Transcript_33100/g.85843  ORF Transcript_33100/g.85843 Transcript_33100/m.85843 type:complete len:289 (-) Transcript_33100:135-1001(-)